MATVSFISVSMPDKNASFDALPSAISDSLISHFAVVLADLKLSSTISIRAFPFFVAIRFFLSLFIKSLEIRFSIMPALVAGVPRPFSSTSTPF